MSGNAFRVASVAMLTCGVDRNGLIRVSKVPSKNGQNEIQAMKNRGCYLEQQFVIESGWTYRKVTSQLRSWFPKVFDYLNLQLEKRQSATSHEEKPIWRLLNKCGQTLTVVDIGFPAGSDLAKHKGRDKASVNDCHLWFAGLDSERDDCNDILLSDTDDSVSIKSDNDLASSLMELDMSSDSDVKDPKGKGKAKAAPARTPVRSQNAKRSHTLLSPSPSEAIRKAVQKKLKKEPASDAAIPLFSTNPGSTSSELEPPLSTQPSAQSNSYQTVSFRTMTSRVPATLKVANKISAPPDFVSISEADVLWRDKIQDDDPFAEYINPWDSRYSMLNFTDLRELHYENYRQQQTETRELHYKNYRQQQIETKELHYENYRQQQMETKGLHYENYRQQQMETRKFGEPTHISIFG
ncbi:hypothetical protein BD769DRAFT_1392023 [Suillus cothurnatus]|nr:hypothetical protein BD769DRAFT_1392023 [Suillus cothurnatus]